MTLLKHYNRYALNESKDDDDVELPYDVFHAIEVNIRNAAKDSNKKILNALELVKEAYKIENIELPNPSMEATWKQFTKLIEYATQTLLKYRGIDGDWRMSDYKLREMFESEKQYNVLIESEDCDQSFTVTLYDIEQLTSLLTNDTCDVKITNLHENMIIEFQRLNVKRPIKITLSESCD